MRGSPYFAGIRERVARVGGQLALALGGIALAIGGPACSGPLAPEEREFERNLVKWRAAKVEYYSYRLQRSCFCGPDTTRPVLITVQAGIVIGGVDPVTFEPIDPPPDGFPTIDDLFEEIREAIATADALDASYDGTLGYPLSVSIDYLKNAIDDEMAFNVSGFERPPRLDRRREGAGEAFQLKLPPGVNGLSTTYSSVSTHLTPPG